MEQVWTLPNTLFPKCGRAITTPARRCCLPPGSHCQVVLRLLFLEIYSIAYSTAILQCTGTRSHPISTLIALTSCSRIILDKSPNHQLWLRSMCCLHSVVRSKMLGRNGRMQNSEAFYRSWGKGDLHWGQAYSAKGWRGLRPCLCWEGHPNEHWAMSWTHSQCHLHLASASSHSLEAGAAGEEQHEAEVRLHPPPQAVILAALLQSYRNNSWEV